MKQQEKNGEKNNQEKKTATSGTSVTPSIDIDNLFSNRNTSHSPVCNACRKIVFNYQDLRMLDGKPYHESCKQRILEGRKLKEDGD